MNHKILFILLMLAAACVFDQGVEAKELEEINYTLFTTENPMDGEPSKYYKLSIASRNTSSPGVVVIKRMDGKLSNMPVIISKEGIIRATDREFAVIGMNGGYAEKFEVLIAAEKGKNFEPIAKCTIIPFPRIIQDDKGHKIELKAMTPDGENFLVTGSGFKPHETITMKSRSCDENATIPLFIDNEGSFFFGYSPAVIGKTEGPFEITFSAEDMKPLKMRHYWGKIAFSGPNKYKTLKAKFPFPEEEFIIRSRT